MEDKSVKATVILIISDDGRVMFETRLGVRVLRDSVTKSKDDPVLQWIAEDIKTTPEAILKCVDIFNKIFNAKSGS